MLSNVALITLVVCFIAVGCSGESSTPQRWQHSVKSGNKTYFVFNQQLTFIEANVQCRLEKMNLLSIDNEQEYENLIAQLSEFVSQPLFIWSSGTVTSDGTWMWLSTGKPITFFDWGDLEPEKTPGTDCLAVFFKSFTKGTYANMACQTPSNFICQL